MTFCGTFIIWAGIALGILDVLTDIAYYSKASFANTSLKSGCLVFIFFQPVWYFFIYLVYIASHTEISSGKERTIKLLIAPIYLALQYLKLLPGIERVHYLFSYMFSFSEKHKFLTLENCYKL